MSTHTVRFEDDDSVVLEVVRTAAAVLDSPVGELPPLDESVDTDLLQRLAVSRTTRSVRGGSITFDYAGLTVTVDVNGEIRIEWE